MSEPKPVLSHERNCSYRLTTSKAGESIRVILLAAWHEMQRRIDGTVAQEVSAQKPDPGGRMARAMK